MKPRSAAARAGTAALLLAVGWLTSCRSGDVATDPPSKPVNELSRHDGEYCPQTMPRASRDSYGFGTEEAASSAPVLWKPQEAWLCRYDPDDVASSGSHGAWYQWVLTDAPRPLDADELKAFTAAVEQLAPAPDSRVCNDDLSSRWLVSYSYENDLTGVVIDDFGCRDIRLTDEPFTTVAGEPSQPGTVVGVLADPTEFIAVISSR